VNNLMLVTSSLLLINCGSWYSAFERNA
jgi:hypothetical protein